MRLLSVSGARRVNPVMFLAGRARLLASPPSTGSLQPPPRASRVATISLRSHAAAHALVEPSGARLALFPADSSLPCLEGRSTSTSTFSAGAVAGWALHPLESAAFARRTPTEDIHRWISSAPKADYGIRLGTGRILRGPAIQIAMMETRQKPMMRRKASR